MVTPTLLTGIPRAAKSPFCDAVEASGRGFTHLPLDRRISCGRSSHWMPVLSTKTIPVKHARSGIGVL